MKKLLVITIIACVSTSAFARRNSSFLGEFDDMVNTMVNAQNKVVTTNVNNNNSAPVLDATDLDYQNQLKTAYYEDLLKQQQTKYENDALKTNSQNTFDVFTANENNAAKYKNQITLNEQYLDANANDKILKNNRLQTYRSKSKRDLILAKSQYKKEAIIGTMQDETDIYVATQQEQGLRDATRESECVKKIQGALQVYGRVALVAMGSDWVRNCPAAESLIAEAQTKLLGTVADDYDNGIAAYGWNPADFTTRN